MTPLLTLFLLLVSFSLTVLVVFGAQNYYTDGKKYFARVTKSFPSGVDTTQDMFWAMKSESIPEGSHGLIMKRARIAYNNKIGALVLSFLVFLVHLFLVKPFYLTLYSASLQDYSGSLVNIFQGLIAIFLGMVFIYNSFLLFSSVFWFIKARGVFPLVVGSRQNYRTESDDG